MTLKIAIQNETLCGSVFFSILKKITAKLENMCAEAGVCSIANIALGEIREDGRVLQQATFDIMMADEQIIRLAATAKTLEDAIDNAFDECELHIAALQKRA